MQRSRLRRSATPPTCPHTPLDLQLSAPPVSRAPCSLVPRRRFPAPHFGPARRLRCCAILTRRLTAYVPGSPSSARRVGQCRGAYLQPASPREAVSVTVEPEAPRSEAPPTAEGRSVARAISHDSPAAAQRGEAAAEAARADARGTSSPPAAADGEPGDDALQYAPSWLTRVRASTRGDTAGGCSRSGSRADRGGTAAARADEEARWTAVSDGKVRARARSGARRQDLASAVGASDWHERTGVCRLRLEGAGRRSRKW